VGQFLRGIAAVTKNVKAALGTGLTRVALVLAGGVIQDGDVELAVGKQGTGIALLDADRSAPGDAAGADLDGTEVALFLDQIDPVVGEDGGTGRRGELVEPELDLGTVHDHRTGLAGPWFHIRDAHGDHLTRFVGSAVGGDDGLRRLVDHHGRVDAGFGQRHTPERFARASIHAHDRPIAGGGVKDPFPAEERQVRMREGVVFGPVAGAGGPDQLAGPLIESVGTVAAGALIAPVAGNAAGEKQIAVHQGRSRAPVRESQTPQHLHEGVLPEKLAAGSEGRQDPLGPLQVHVAGLRIDRGRRSRVSLVDDVAQEIGEPVSPQGPAGLRVETGQRFLQLGPLADVTQNVKPPVRDHRCRFARELGRPERLRLRPDPLGQTGLAGEAALLRAAPAQPTASGRDGGWGEQRRSYPAGYQPTRVTPERTVLDLHIGEIHTRTTRCANAAGAPQTGPIFCTGRPYANQSPPPGSTGDPRAFPSAREGTCQSRQARAN